MVRGNWQKRVERTEARRVANKLQKEHRRAKRLSSNNEDKAQRATWYRILSDWIDDTEFFPPDNDDEDYSAEDDTGQYNLVIDIWTDARPKNRQEYLPESNNNVENDDDFEEEEGRGGKGRSKAKTKDRGGFKKNKGKKKAHPNTRQKTDDDEEDLVRIRRESRSNSMSVKEDDKLCAKEFFFGKEKCPAMKLLQQRQKGGKRSNYDNSAGCSLRHYHQFPKVKSKVRQSPPLTLAQVVNGKYQPHPNNKSGSKHPASLPLKVKEATLQNAYNAMLGIDDDGEDAADTSSETNACIESIYHTRFFVSSSSGNDQEGDKDDENERADRRSAVLEALEQLLNREKLTQTSIIYLAIQGVLVYDLNRGGLVLSETEEDFLETGEDIDVDAFLSYNTVDTVQSSEPSYIHEELSHHILYEILSYLPDEAAAVLPQVCKAWDVGTKSPQLWKMLLSRHNWPHYTTTHEQNGALKTDADDIELYKDAFVSHYVAARDIRAIASATSLLCGDSDSKDVSKTGIEFAMQRYKSTQGAPVMIESMPSNVMVKVWPKSVYAEHVGARALAAYQHDHTLRLFEATPRTNTPGSMKCRQIACVKVVPPSVSQRRAGGKILLDMDLDEDDVACLFSCQPENSNESWSSFVTIISRDDLACAGNEGLIDNDSLKEFDVHAMILDFLLCGADHYDNLQTALHDYLSTGDGETSQIKVDVSPSLIACGKGYFLIHAHIEIPVESGDDLDESDRTAGHRIFLLSMKKGRVVKAIHLQNQPPLKYRQILASTPSKCYVSSDNATSVRKLCTNVVVTNWSVYTQEKLNFFVQIANDGSAEVQMKAIIESQPEPVARHEASGIPAIVTSNCFITASKVSVSSRSNLVFCEDENVYTVDIAPNSRQICDMFCIRDEYVAVVLRKRQGQLMRVIAGQWVFLDEEEDISTTTSSAKEEIVVFHISSRQEVFRCPFSYSVPFRMCCNDGTIAANVSIHGFVIAGANAREVARSALSDEAEASQTPTKTTKAKKKRLASLASGRKKDGFARGMSMRG